MTKNSKHVVKTSHSSNIIGQNKYLKNKIFHKNGKKRIVLLQGPVGNFFQKLQKHLEEQGLDCWRVLFNAGDRFYSNGKKNIVYNDGQSEWADWFYNFLILSKADSIVLFGAERAIHKTAREIANELGINIISLEEGYVRPGFITVESGGNNGSSPIAGKLPPSTFEANNSIQAQKHNYNGFTRMCWHGAIYYTARTLFSSFSQRELFHKRINLFREMFGWLRNASRRFKSTSVTFKKIQSLLEYYEKKYFLVPLQVTTDMQLAHAALGWNNSRLIMEALRSFAEHAPKDHKLVFKIHPLERGHSNDQKLIRQTAELLDISNRVHVLDNGSLGLMTRHAAGMITINSTSGLSAIYHGIPLLVIGQALYANPQLATCAHGTPNFDQFWIKNYVAQKELRQDYINWIKSECLKAGDFYHKNGIEVACKGIYEVILKNLDKNPTKTITQLKNAS